MIYIAISDIHGRGKAFSNLLTKINTYRKSLNEESKVVFLGDYCDRFYDNLLTLKKVMNYQKKYPESIVLRGNHESFMLGTYDLDYLDSDEYGYKDYLLNFHYSSASVYNIWTYKGNGGDITSSELMDKKDTFAKIVKWIKDLPTIYSENNIYFSHAPLYDYKENISEYTSGEKLWDNKLEKYNKGWYDSKTLNVHGHIHNYVYNNTEKEFNNVQLKYITSNHLNVSMFFNDCVGLHMEEYCYATAFKYENNNISILKYIIGFKKNIDRYDYIYDTMFSI